jgi:nucleoside-diphosphate-sugar epimerase
MKILITGGNGFIAKALYEKWKNVYDLTTITRQDFDLTAFEAVSSFFQDKYFDVVLHCAVQGGSRLKQDTFYNTNPTTENLSILGQVLSLQIPKALTV